MRDDDDLDPDEPKGRVFYSGINPDADRAGYALPVGEPALQDRGVEFEREAVESNVPNRRLVLCLGVGIGLAATAGVFHTLGFFDRVRARDITPTADPRRSRRVEWLIRAARKAAGDSLDDLVASYGTFIMVLEEYAPDDRALWGGVERLARYAMVDRGEKGVRIARRLLPTFEQLNPPAGMAHLVLELEDLIWRWERRTKK